MSEANVVKVVLTDKGDIGRVFINEEEIPPAIIRDVKFVAASFPIVQLTLAPGDVFVMTEPVPEEA